MSTPTRTGTFAVFQFRAYRFQWPADLATSCAFEMETLILGWYILTETRSVFWLTAYASLQYLGTLISPMMGVVGDRIGPRNLLAGMRSVYVVLTLTLLIVISFGLLSPVIAFAVAFLMGLVRPSDNGMRVAVLGTMIPSSHAVGAIGIQRITVDGSKIGGALLGAGLVAALGMAYAYVVIVALHATSVFLTVRAGAAQTVVRKVAASAEARSPWRDLKDGARYASTQPVLVAVLCLALMLNLTIFPIWISLQPYVAKEVYGAGQTGLGYMVAAGGFGALVGALASSRFGRTFRAGRMMLIGSTVWCVVFLVFAHATSLNAGIPLMFLAGVASAMSQVPMQTLLLRLTEERFRSRVLGLRMLVIYGNMVGLLVAGPLIAALGFKIAVSLYCTIGIGSTFIIAMYWRRHLWPRDAAANRR